MNSKNIYIFFSFCIFFIFLGISLHQKSRQQKTHELYTFETIQLIEKLDGQPSQKEQIASASPFSASTAEVGYKKNRWQNNTSASDFQNRSLQTASYIPQDTYHQDTYYQDAYYIDKKPIAKAAVPCTNYSSPKIKGLLRNPSRLYLNHTEGNWLDNQDGYTSLEKFSELIFLKDNCMTCFLDVKGHLFNHGRLGANAGMVFRYQKNPGANIFGVNAYFDYRQGSWNYNFHQVGIGFEYLSSIFDIRVNSYIPIGNSHSHSSTTVFHYSDGFHASVQDQRVAQGGVDVEIGSWLKKQSATSCTDLYAALGYYYYAPKKNFRNDYGVKARLETHLSDYCTFELKGGFDEVYRSMAQGTLSFQVPLDTLCAWGGICLKNSKSKNSCMTHQLVRRQDIIALSKKQCYWRWNWDTAVVPCCGE